MLRNKKNFLKFFVILVRSGISGTMFIKIPFNFNNWMKKNYKIPFFLINVHFFLIFIINVKGNTEINNW